MRQAASRPLPRTLEPMSSRAQPIGHFIAIVALLFACAGGTYFGLFSCGGYVWESQIYWAVSALLVTLALVLSRRVLGNWVRRLAFLIIYLVTFTLSQAAAMPFYPAAPESFAEYRRNFILALEYGPCP